MEMINPMFVLRSLKRRCYGNQLIEVLFANIKIDQLQSLLYSSVMECSIAICIRVINTDDDVAISRKNVVNFGVLTPKITFLICVPSCGYWAKIGRRSQFVALAFPNVLDD